MRTFRTAALAMLALSLTVAGARAVDYGATSANVTPTHFHWTMLPTGSNVKSYHFDSHHGWWSATLTHGDVTVSDHGLLPNGERGSFYQGLAANGAWNLEAPAKASEGPHYNYVVSRGQDEHSVSFSGTPSPEFDKLITYVNGTLVGQEEKTLESRLSSLPAPPPKK